MTEAPGRSGILSNRKRALNRPLPIANGVFGKGLAGAPGQAVCDWKGHPSAPGMTVCDWSAEAALPDAISRPGGFVGKGLPTYDRTAVGRESFRDAVLRPCVCVGKGLPTYEGCRRLPPTAHSSVSNCRY